MEWGDYLQKIDSLIKAGKHGEAISSLVKVRAKNKASRRYWAELANIYYRLGQPLKAVNLLHKVIRPSQGKESDASLQESIHYAKSLLYLGIKEEPKTILTQLEKQYDRNISISKALGHLHIATWDYHLALNHFQTALELESTPYSKLILKLNIISCYLYLNEFDLAKKSIEECSELSPDEWPYALFYLQELKLILYYSLEDWESFNHVYSSCEQLYPEMLTKSFTMRKWYASAKAFQSHNVEHLEAIYQEAKDRNHGEILRDLDFQKCKIQPSQELFQKLYWGTPFQMYRKNLTQSHQQYSLPNEYAHGNRDSNESLHLENCQWNNRSLFKPGQAPHRLLQVLLNDFYAPKSIPSLFEGVYPHEFFNPDTCPGKMYQLLNRLRTKLKAFDCPIDINEKSGRYWLSFDSSSMHILIKKEELLLSPAERKLNTFKENWNIERDFTRKDFENVLHLNTRNANKVLRQFQEEGLVSAKKVGKSKIYKLTA